MHHFPPMRYGCWPGPWNLQLASLIGLSLGLQQHPKAHHKRRRVQGPRWMTFLRSAGRAMQWRSAYGWTIQRMTSIKGERSFIDFCVYSCQQDGSRIPEPFIPYLTTVTLFQGKGFMNILFSAASLSCFYKWCQLIQILNFLSVYFSPYVEKSLPL